MRAGSFPILVPHKFQVPYWCLARNTFSRYIVMLDALMLVYFRFAIPFLSSSKALNNHVFLG